MGKFGARSRRPSGPFLARQRDAVTRFGYDANGNQTSQSTEVGLEHRHTQTTYDAANKILTQSTGPVNIKGGGASMTSKAVNATRFDVSRYEQRFLWGSQSAEANVD